MTPSNEHVYTMSISLNVLNHLGIGLYSNVPAVLSEMVANAWDADADNVTISIDVEGNKIVVEDDGIGMTPKEINEKYLNVGYRRRDSDSVITAKGRHVMGRKGIGKLSVFSMAEIVEVYSKKEGRFKRGSLRMVRSDIKRLIEDGGTEQYHPESIEPGKFKPKKGTRLVLKDIDKSLAVTGTFLRKRLARRFSIIGSEHDFAVTVDDEPITAKDRDFFRRFEFVWYFGAASAGVKDKCKNLRAAILVDNSLSVPAVESSNDRQSEGDNRPPEIVKLSGWIGSVDEHKGIDEANNTIAVFAHGKLIHEDLMTTYKEGGLYSEYLVGEIDADFMDSDEKDDIVTSNRQQVKENDLRFGLLKDHVWGVLKVIQEQWRALRRDSGVEKALELPVIREWYERLGRDRKKHAEKLFGKIESLKLPDQASRRELYKSSLLAFERLALKDALSALDQIDTEAGFAALHAIFDDIDELEAAHYYEVVRGRLEVIRRFENILPDSKEKVLQKHIFDHLWLLHPSWERAASNIKIEESVQKEFDAVTAKLTQDEKRGRIDIRYRTAGGKHVIIELKKYDRKVDVYALAKQVGKYRRALLKCLKAKYPEESRQVEVVCVLGSTPQPEDDLAVVDAVLRAESARFITYDTLIKQTLASYQEYLDRQIEISELSSIIDRVDKELLADDGE